MQTTVRGVRGGISSGFVLGRTGPLGKRGKVGVVSLSALGFGIGQATGTGSIGTPGSSSSGAAQGIEIASNAGTWSSLSNYTAGQIVRYTSGFYICVVDVTATATTPAADTAHWTQLAIIDSTDLDQAFGSTEGNILQRGAAGWIVLAPGTANQVLASGGAAALNSWSSLSTLLDAAFGSAQGDVLYRGASGWVVLAPGTANQLLVTGGAAANPAWAYDHAGVATNSNAAAGMVGEYISSSVLPASALPATSTTPLNITSISLTAGDWDVRAMGAITGGSLVTSASYSISTTSATLPTDGAENDRASINLGTNAIITGTRQAVGPTRLSLASTTTVYLVATITFNGGGAASVYGFLAARRMR